MRTIALLILTLSSAVLADEVTFQFRSMEDPAFPAEDSVCAQAPFAVNVKLGASLWSQHTRGVDGRIVNESVRRIGRATACVQLTSFLFPPGLSQNFYASFDLPSGRYTGVGSCLLSSNDVPQAGLVLAGCTLKLISGPSPVLGGLITSATTFNPFQLAGFNTGSLWTVQGYTSEPVSWRPWNWNRGFQLHDDRRSDTEIEQARQRAGGHR